MVNKPTAVHLAFEIHQVRSTKVTTTKNRENPINSIKNPADSRIQNKRLIWAQFCLLCFLFFLFDSGPQIAVGWSNKILQFQHGNCWPSVFVVYAWNFFDVRMFIEHILPVGNEIQAIKHLFIFTFSLLAIFFEYFKLVWQFIRNLTCDKTSWAIAQMLNNLTIIFFVYLKSRNLFAHVTICYRSNYVYISNSKVTATQYLFEYVC